MLNFGPKLLAFKLILSFFHHNRFFSTRFISFTILYHKISMNHFGYDFSTCSAPHPIFERFWNSLYSPNDLEDALLQFTTIIEDNGSLSSTPSNSLPTTTPHPSFTHTFPLKSSQHHVSTKSKDLFIDEENTLLQTQSSLLPSIFPTTSTDQVTTTHDNAISSVISLFVNNNNTNTLFSQKSTNSTLNSDPAHSLNDNLSPQESLSTISNYTNNTSPNLPHHTPHLTSQFLSQLFSSSLHILIHESTRLQNDPSCSEDQQLSNLKNRSQFFSLPKACLSSLSSPSSSHSPPSPSSTLSSTYLRLFIELAYDQYLTQQHQLHQQHLNQQHQQPHPHSTPPLLSPTLYQILSHKTLSKVQFANESHQTEPFHFCLCFFTFTLLAPFFLFPFPSSNSTTHTSQQSSSPYHNHTNPHSNANLNFVLIQKHVTLLTHSGLLNPHLSLPFPSQSNHNNADNDDPTEELNIEIDDLKLTSTTFSSHTTKFGLISHINQVLSHIRAFIYSFLLFKGGMRHFPSAVDQNSLEKMLFHIIWSSRYRCCYNHSVLSDSTDSEQVFLGIRTMLGEPNHYFDSPLLPFSSTHYQQHTSSSSSLSSSSTLSKQPINPKIKPFPMDSINILNQIKHIVIESAQGSILALQLRNPNAHTFIQSVTPFMNINTHQLHLAGSFPTIHLHSHSSSNNSSSFSLFTLKSLSQTISPFSADNPSRVPLEPPHFDFKWTKKLVLDYLLTHSTGFRSEDSLNQVLSHLSRDDLLFRGAISTQIRPARQPLIPHHHYNFHSRHNNNNNNNQQHHPHANPFPNINTFHYNGFNNNHHTNSSGRGNQQAVAEANMMRLIQHINYLQPLLTIIRQEELLKPEPEQHTLDRITSFERMLSRTSSQLNFPPFPSFPFHQSSTSSTPSFSQLLLIQQQLRTAQAQIYEIYPIPINQHYKPQTLYDHASIHPPSLFLNRVVVPHNPAHGPDLSMLPDIVLSAYDVVRSLRPPCYDHLNPPITPSSIPNLDLNNVSQPNRHLNSQHQQYQHQHQTQSERSEFAVDLAVLMQDENLSTFQQFIESPSNSEILQSPCLAQIKKSFQLYWRQVKGLEYDIMTQTMMLVLKKQRKQQNSNSNLNSTNPSPRCISSQTYSYPQIIDSFGPENSINFMKWCVEMVFVNCMGFHPPLSHSIQSPNETTQPNDVMGGMCSNRVTSFMFQTGSNTETPPKLIWPELVSVSPLSPYFLSRLQRHSNPWFLFDQIFAQILSTALLIKEIFDQCHQQD